MEFNLPKINWRDRQHGRKELLSTERDWRVMCALASLALIAIFGLYFWAGGKIKQLESSGNESATSSSTKMLTREEVTNYATQVEKRRTEFELLISGN